MKVISIKNPWAILICMGIKPIENRTWATSYRGRAAIHASQRTVGNDLETILNYQQYNSMPLREQIQLNNGIWTNGAIIGEVDIVDCVLGHASVWAEHSAMVKRKINGIYETVEVPVYNWVLDNAELYAEPITNVKGKLSFWEYSG